MIEWIATSPRAPRNIVAKTPRQKGPAVFHVKSKEMVKYTNNSIFNNNTCTSCFQKNSSPSPDLVVLLVLVSLPSEKEEYNYLVIEPNSADHV